MISVEEKEREKERECKSVVLLLQGIMKSAECGYKGGCKHDPRMCHSLLLFGAHDEGILSTRLLLIRIVV